MIVSPTCRRDSRCRVGRSAEKLDSQTCNRVVHVVRKRQRCHWPTMNNCQACARAIANDRQQRCHWPTMNNYRVTFDATDKLEQVVHGVRLLALTAASQHQRVRTTSLFQCVRQDGEVHEQSLTMDRRCQLDNRAVVPCEPLRPYRRQPCADPENFHLDAAEHQEAGRWADVEPVRFARFDSDVIDKSTVLAALVIHEEAAVDHP